MSLTLDALAAFEEFSRSMNFTRAAENLNISQPALHTKIKRLSESLDRTLYVKEGRRLELTPHGQEVVRFARELREKVDAFVGRLSAGSVVLAAGKGSYLYLLGQAVQEFRRRSNSELELLTTHREDTLRALRLGLAHLGVTVLETVPRDVTARLIHRVSAALVVPRDHPLAERKRVHPRQLEGVRLVVPPEGRPHRQTLHRVTDELGVRWEVALEAEGWELMLHFARLGLGLAVVNGCCRVPEELVAVPLSGFPPVNYYLVKKRSFDLSPDQRLLEELIERNVGRTPAKTRL